MIDATMLDKMRILKGLAKKKGWVFSLNAPCLVHHKNGQVEKKLATLFKREPAMFNSGKFNPFLRNSLWTEATNTVTLPQNNLLILSRDVSSFQLFLARKEMHSNFSTKI